MKDWISVDIETSGLDPCFHEVIEVGMCASNGNTETFSLPFDVDKASQEALGVNGWGMRDFAPEVDVFRGMGILQGAFEGGALVVASPAHFDVGFLEQLFRRNGVDPPWSHRAIIDIKTFACARFGVLTDLRNAEIARILDVAPNPNAHTAVDDAIWQAEIFRGLIR